MVKAGTPPRSARGEPPRRVVHALFFFPRGGSAQVVRALCRELPDEGWRPSLAVGSLGAPGELGHAATFFAGADVHAVDYTAAHAVTDPLAAPVPFQPSFEDRPGSPDRVFAAVADEPYERLVSAWADALDRAGAGSADVLHLHHLTPIHEAALRAFPGVPRVGHLHGTELAMLRVVRAGAPAGWTHAGQWVERMRRWAASCERLVSAQLDVAEMADLLGVPADRFVTVGNGVDTRAFDRRPLAGDARVALWRRWLVDEPRGWDESGVPGSVRYTEGDLAAFADPAPVLLYVGRYTAVKRLPWLIDAYARAQRRIPGRAPLVIVGGYPGEWEGEHPLRAVRRTGARDVFLAGWHGHEDLPQAFAGSDALVLPSRHEAFGIVLVEAMASGLPTIACAVPGPAGIVDDGETGWLVGEDDGGGLADALARALGDAEERQRRGELAYARSRARWSWAAAAARIAALYAASAARPRAPAASARTR